MPKLSVIIPVYNVADYLDKCLWSITNQTFKELEIIIVNDGSTDNSPSIIEKYATNDARIKVINQSNQGLSMARKAGLLACTADYIHHMDGDDFLELNCYEVMVGEALAKDADIAFMKFWFQEGDNLRESKSYDKDRLDRVSLLTRMWETSEYYSVWHYIHKRALHDNNIEFERGLCIGEDAYQTTQLLYYSHKIISVDIPFYHYILRGTSIVNNTLSDKKARDILLFHKLILDFMRNKPEYAQLKYTLYCAYTKALCFILSAHQFKNCTDDCRKVVQMNKEYPELYRTLKTSHLRKLIEVFASNEFLGRIYAQYYIWKKKI